MGELSAVQSAKSFGILDGHRLKHDKQIIAFNYIYFPILLRSKFSEALPQRREQLQQLLQNLCERHIVAVPEGYPSLKSDFQPYAVKTASSSRLCAG